MMSSAPTRPAAAVQDWTHQHQNAFVEDLRTAVHAETPSNNKPLLDNGLTTIREILLLRLGEPLTETRYQDRNNGDVLDLLWAGQDSAGQPLDDPAAAVLMVCHYDTVWPAGTIDHWPLSAEGDKLTGPGVLDMKFGIIQTAWALIGLRRFNIAHPPLRLLLTGDEEVGSAAGRPRIEAAAKESVLTLVTEPSAGGDPKDRRKGMVFADLKVTGVQAHAGLEPDKGASAVHALAALLGEITALANPDLGTTINVGTFHGGTGRNVVAGTAEAMVDVRVTVPEEQQRVANALQSLQLPQPFAADDRLTLQLEVDANRPPMNPTAATKRALAQLLDVAAQQGRTLTPRAVGGASDANFVSALGLPVIDGLGAIGEGPHAAHEHILLSGIAPQTGLLAGLLATQLR